MELGIILRGTGKVDERACQVWWPKDDCKRGFQKVWDRWSMAPGRAARGVTDI